MFNDTTVFVGSVLCDKQTERCFLDPDGQVIEESCIPTSAAALTRKSASLAPCWEAMEVSTLESQPGPDRHREEGG